MDYNSTQSHLVGWQLDNDNRSAWDILWACASTIFACTWTVIHADVPNRDASNLRQVTMFLRTWLMTLLVPEATFGFAWLQLVKARESKNKYNVARTHRQNGSKPHDHPKERPSVKTPDDEETEQWSLAQAFCVNAGGLALRTKDEWIYSVSSDEEMTALIKSGTVKISDFSDQEIESRAKADSFAKLFTLFQVTWFLCNVVARWGYHLPVSPLEVATVSYVFLAVFTYLSWWYKPKDISAPILAILPCDRQTLEDNFHGIINTRQWKPLLSRAKKESRLKTIMSSLTSPIFVLDTPQDGEVVRKTQVDSVSFISLASVVIYSSAGIAYSGIHLAA